MDWATLITILVAIESQGNRGVIGDVGTRYPAVGILQIRQPYLDDVNRVAGTDIKMVDVRKSPGIARWAAVTYLRHYGKVMERRAGRKPNAHDFARIHNGGPNGWRREATDAYIAKFERECLRRNIQSIVMR